MRAFVATLLLGLLGAQPLLCQREHPAFRRFGLAQGLPQSQVTSLLEDRHGFIWVGTISGGVARLGASGFRIFGAAEGLQVRSVWNMLEDRQGHVWVAGRDGGLSEIAGDRVLNHGEQTGIPEPRIYSLALDGEGRLLVGSAHGLYRREGASFRPVALPGEWSKLPLFDLAVDAKGELTAMTRNGRLIHWDGKVLKEDRLPGVTDDLTLRDLAADPQGRVWALTETQLFRKEADRWVRHPLPGLPREPKLSALSFSPDSEPLIAMGGDGLWYQEKGKARVLTHADGLPRDLIRAVLRDRQGGLWVGSDGDGMAALFVPGLWSYGRADGAPVGDQDLGAVMGLVPLGGGRILLGGSQGLILFQQGRGVLRRWTKTDGLRSDSVWTMLPARPSGVWLGTDRGIQRWTEGSIRPGPKELDQIFISHLVRQDNLIYAASEKGLFILDEQGRVVRKVEVPAAVGSPVIGQVLPRGDEIILSGFAGIMSLKEGRIRMVDPPELARLQAGSLLVDSRKRLWVAATSGLFRQEGQGMVRIGTREGLLDENLTWMEELRPDHFAVGHGRGLSILRPEGVQHLTRNLGLLSDETNQNAVAMDDEGRMWLGLMGGINRLDDPLAFRNQPVLSPTVLEARWPGGFAALPTGAEIPPRPEFLEIRFDLGQPGLPAAPRYQALLDGADRTWRDVSSGNALQYLNPGPGRRQFRLRASIDGIHWVEAPTLNLVIRPAWHERWSVRGLLILALAAMVALAVRWRLHRMAVAARELEALVEDRTHMLDRQYKALAQAHEQIRRSLEARVRLVDMVTHDLRSPLTSITLVADRLREEEDPEARAYLLGLLERENTRIDELLRGLLDRSRAEAAFQNMKPVPVTPLEVLEGIQEVLRLKAEARGLQFHLDIPGDMARAKILADPTPLRQAILNLFENALKFTPEGGSVGLRSRLDLATLEWVLAIWDTGRGIPKDRQDSILQPFAQVHEGDAEKGWGLGLSIVQNLVEAHGGTLSLESEEGQGTTFFIALPLLEH